MKKTFLEFLTSKELDQEKFDAMTANEKAGLYNEYNQQLKEYIEGLAKDLEEKPNQEDIQKKIDEAVAKLHEQMADQMKALNDALIEVGLAIKAQSEVSSEDISLTSRASLSKGLKDNAEALKAMKETGQGKVTLKVVGDMTITGNVTGEVPQAQREAGLNRVARRRTFIRELISSGIATSNLISWVEQTGIEGSPGGTTEGSLKNQIDFDLVVAQESVKKRTAFIKISTEMLDDIDFIRSEVDIELRERLGLDVDDQLLNGDNIGQNLNGIVTQQTAFAAGIFATDVDNANLVDVLTVAADQIEAANHFATSHVLNGRDVTALKLVKLSTTDKRYIDRLITVAGQMELDGIPIVTNNGVTQGEHLTMDGSKAAVFTKGEMTIQIGLDSDDFTKNFRTILIEWRGLIRIKGNDLTAFVGGNIATSEAALETI